MTARIEKVVTSGTFSLDGQDFAVDNNVWLIGDDREVLVIDAAHDPDAILAGRPGICPPGRLSMWTYAHCCRPGSGSSVVSGQCHYCVRAHCNVTASPQMSDESGAATRSLAVSSREEAHDLTVELEVDFGVRQQTRTFTDLARNSHLTFGCDAHQWISCKLRTISHQEV